MRPHASLEDERPHVLACDLHASLEDERPHVSLEPRYEWRDGGGRSLHALIGDAPVRLDPVGVRAAFGEVEPSGATCIAGARQVQYTGRGRAARRLATRPLRSLLREACADLPPGRVALALSGGVDSAVLAALLRDRVVAYTLATLPTLPGYGEESEALAVARSFGIEARLVAAGEEELVAAVPDAVRACACPFYNLHPVSRLLVARAARADGFDWLVTGDGADQVFRGTSGADYLPLMGSLGRAAGVFTIAPFLHPALQHVSLDPDKRALRLLALELGVPPDIALSPKRGRFAPPTDLARHRDGPLADALARSLGRKPTYATDRERVGFATLALFARSFPGLAL